MAEATVEETFPEEFGIWDLNKLLGTVGLFDTPNFEFGDKHMVISGGGSRVKYYYSDPKLLTTINKELKMPEIVVNTTMSEDHVKEIHRAASILQLPDLSICSDQGSTVIKINDRKDPTSNNFVLEVGETDKEFDFRFKVENLKLYPGSYDVEVASGSVARFTHGNLELKYFVAMEPDSRYDG
tara:strand:- start:528 stop:1076 length:549 start_codon:yes stop_codon:yes gene_type:complete